MELQGLDRSARPALRAPLALTLLALAVAAVLLVAAPLARAGSTVTVDPNVPQLITSPTTRPLGYTLNARTVERIAARAPVIVAELRRHPDARAYEYTKGPGRWQVSWFSKGPNGKELAQVYVSDATGKVTEAWTGFQVAWTMARGYPGAFGRRVNAWYIWIPLCLMFIAPFVPRRRRLTWLHLDLLVLLAFSVSLALFNHARIGLSVPLVYPCLIYLMVRMLLLAAGRGRPREPLRLLVPVSWLAIGAIFLIGFRIGLNVANSNVIDVGYAGVIGADKLDHGKPLYGNWPHDNALGDTYGPFTYYAYVPFRAIFGWSGLWDDLPAAHAAAIAFDLLVLLGLFLLGRMIRGPTLGIVLVYAWAAYPFTLWTLSSNTNDALVAFTIVLALLVARRPAPRGFAGALATMTKFAPLALAPLLLRGTGDRPRARPVALSALAFGVTAVLLMLPVVLDHNLHAFWRDTVAYQANRVTPFSVWGLWGGLGFEQRLVEGAAVALALAAAVVPRRLSTMQMAALASAIVICLQMAANYWLYSYIVWFLPGVLLVLFASHPSELEFALGQAERLDARRLVSAEA